MIAEITTGLFYLFAGVLLLAGMGVITSKNSVYAVFFLILAFFNAAALFVLLGAEYMAMTLLIVYVGAVAVLFLFVVMMLNVNIERVRSGFVRALPLGILVSGALLIEMGLLLTRSFLTPVPLAPAMNPIPDPAHVSNAKAIGQVLYTDYMLAFQLAGVILLTAMIGAIVLTHRHRLGVRRQVIAQQIGRTREEAVALVNVKPGQGI